MLGGLPALRATRRLVQARVASSRSQKKVSLAVRPCAASRPRAWVSGNCSRRDALVALAAEAEFAGLLDRIDGVAAGVGERDDLRLRGLRLQQEGGEVGG